MTMLTVELESEWVRTLRPLDDRPLDSFLKELAVLELYRRHQVSSGKAAELLGMDRMEFVRYAARQGIPFFDLTEEEFSAELDLLATI